MSLRQLNVHHLRNISNARITLHPSFNFILGTNGSGKTTLLEAIYLLSTGHSFRTREINPLIQNDHDILTVFGRTDTDETVSIQKSNTGQTHVQINKQVCRSSSELAYFLPCQVFYQDIFHIIDAGPSVRRSLLDWGMFHVKHDYLKIWKDFRRVLKQRNALLRQKASRKYFIAWDKQLTELSMQLDTMRATYFSDWMVEFKRILTQLSDVSVELDYFSGWGSKKHKTACSLSEILEEQFESDLHRQYTQSGAHQADLIFKAEISGKAKLIYSRGQQKIILIALKLAQASFLKKKCVYLFDDLPSELDSNHLERLFSYLKNISGQFIVTSTSKIEHASLIQDSTAHEISSIIS